MNDSARYTFDVYNLSKCAAFRRLNDPFGGLHNFSTEYPLLINGFYVKCAEALYQACKFTDHPTIQNLILTSKNGYQAKGIAWNSRRYWRLDWLDVNVSAMRWVLQSKVAANSPRLVSGAKWQSQ